MEDIVLNKVLDYFTHGWHKRDKRREEMKLNNDKPLELEYKIGYQAERGKMARGVKTEKR